MNILKIQEDIEFSQAIIPSGTQLIFLGKDGNDIGLKTINHQHYTDMLISPGLKEYWNSKVEASSGILPILNGKNLLNVKPITQRIDIVGGVNSENVIWSHSNTMATFIHNMNCIPIVVLYDNQNTKLNNLNIHIDSPSGFTINFLASQTNNQMYCIVNYGAEWGDPTAIANQLTTYVQQAETAKNESILAKNEAKEYAIAAEKMAKQITIGKCTGLGVTYGTDSNVLNWIDPNDVILNDSILTRWNSTILVRKENSYPSGYTDGVILATTSRTLANKNYYRDHNFIDNAIQTGKTYYYMLFSESETGCWNNLGASNQYPPTTNYSWSMIQQFVRAGRGAQLFPVGTIFSVNHAEYGDLNFRVVGHDQIQPADETLTHSMCLDMVNCLFKATSDAPQFLYSLTEDRVAITGKNYYTLSGTTYTLLIQGTDWNPGDPIPLASWYEKNVDTNRSSIGSNHPTQSNLLQWLNSDGLMNVWFTKQTIWDKCGTSLLQKHGFLKNLDPLFLDVVKEAKLIRAKANVDGGGSITFNRKFFILSLTQILGYNNNGYVENAYLDYYKNGGSKQKSLIGTDIPIQWWAFSSEASYSCSFSIILPSESWAGGRCDYYYGVSPACIIA